MVGVSGWLVWSFTDIVLFVPGYSGTHYVAKDVLELLISLPPLPPSTGIAGMSHYIFLQGLVHFEKPQDGTLVLYDSASISSKMLRKVVKAAILSVSVDVTLKGIHFMQT